MAADSNMGFHQGIISSPCYEHHMLSFQSGALDTTSGIISGGLSTPGGSSGMAGFPTVFDDMLAMGAAGSSSSTVLREPVPVFKHVTGHPANWSPQERATLEEGLVKFAHESNILKYSKIAAQLPNKTIRDVAIRCCWMTCKENSKRRKTEYHTGKKIRETKEKMVIPTSTANVHTVFSGNMALYPVTARQVSQSAHFTCEGFFGQTVPALDDVLKHLLNDNNQVLNQIAANLATFRVSTFRIKENIDLLCHVRNNITSILLRISEMPGPMSQMRPLPEAVNDSLLNSMLSLNRKL